MMQQEVSAMQCVQQLILKRGAIHVPRDAAAVHGVQPLS